MFSFLKPEMAPEGPVEFDVALQVDRPASEVYALLDWADPRNAKRDLGHKVEVLDGQPGRFLLIMTEMPEHRFEIIVTEAEPGRSYRFFTDISPRVGRLMECHEHYQIEPIDDSHCRLSLKTIATFTSGLTMKEYEMELTMMTVACHNGIAKLKIHAEDGADAVRAAEAQLPY